MLNLSVSTPKYFELRQPSLKIPYRSYRSEIITEDDRSNGFVDFTKNPLALYPDEKINAYVQNASDEISAVILWLGTGGLPQNFIPPRPTHFLTGYADSNLVAGSWTSISPTYDQDLPKGRYAVVGMRAGSYKATNVAPIATRLVLNDSVYRIGVITRELGGDKTLMKGSIRGWEKFPVMQGINFTEKTLPTLEMLGADAATDHVIELDLVKTQ